MNLPSERQLDAAGLASVVLCCALWGGNAVAVKFAVPDLPAMGCAGLRYLIGLPIVASVCRASRQPFWGGRRALPWIGLHALLTVAQIGTFNWGTSLSLAGRASVFINVHPLVVAPLAWFVLGERMDIRGLFGLGAAATGVSILLSGALRGGGGNLVGDLIVLGSGVIFGVQTIAQKLTFPHVPPATLLFSQSVIAIPIFLAYSVGFEGIEAFHFTRGAVLGVLYQGLAASGLCYTLWFVLLRRYPAGRLSTIAFLTPIFGIGFGKLFNGESLTWPLVVGGGLVGAGISLVASAKVGRVSSSRARSQVEPIVSRS